MYSGQLASTFLPLIIVFSQLLIRLIKLDEVAEFNWNQSSVTEHYLLSVSLIHSLFIGAMVTLTVDQ